jgi:hypothetical protein
MLSRDIYVITYGSKWAWKYESSIVQATYKTQEEAIFYAKQKAKEYESDLFVEQPNGKFKKVKI